MKEREVGGATTGDNIDLDCRTLDLGIQGFAECLRQGPSGCQYAMPFGYAFLCSHPRLCRGTASGNVKPPSQQELDASDPRN